jgi:TRAP-type C4-dicarboxylate transport system permease small subunit
VFFEGIMGTLLIPNLILSRSISYYAQIVFGAIVTLISLILKPKNYKEQMQFVKSINKPKEKSC